MRPLLHPPSLNDVDPDPWARRLQRLVDSRRALEASSLPLFDSKVAYYNSSQHQHSQSSLRPTRPRSGCLGEGAKEMAGTGTGAGTETGTGAGTETGAGTGLVSRSTLAIHVPDEKDRFTADDEDDDKDQNQERSAVEDGKAPETTQATAQTMAPITADDGATAALLAHLGGNGRYDDIQYHYHYHQQHCRPPVRPSVAVPVTVPVPVPVPCPHRHLTPPMAAVASEPRRVSCDQVEGKEAPETAAKAAAMARAMIVPPAQVLSCAHADPTRVNASRGGDRDPLPARTEAPEEDPGCRDARHPSPTVSSSLPPPSSHVVADAARSRLLLLFPPTLASVRGTASVPVSDDSGEGTPTHHYRHHLPHQQYPPIPRGYRRHHERQNLPPQTDVPAAAAAPIDPSPPLVSTLPKDHASKGGRVHRSAYGDEHDDVDYYYYYANSGVHNGAGDYNSVSAAAGARDNVDDDDNKRDVDYLRRHLYQYPASASLSSSASPPQPSSSSSSSSGLRLSNGPSSSLRRLAFEAFLMRASRERADHERGRRAAAQATIHGGHPPPPPPPSSSSSSSPSSPITDKNKDRQDDNTNDTGVDGDRHYSILSETRPGRFESVAEVGPVEDCAGPSHRRPWAPLPPPPPPRRWQWNTAPSPRNHLLHQQLLQHPSLPPLPPQMQQQRQQQTTSTTTTATTSAPLADLALAAAVAAPLPPSTTAVSAERQGGGDGNVNGPPNDGVDDDDADANADADDDNDNDKTKRQPRLHDGENNDKDKNHNDNNKDDDENIKEKEDEKKEKKRKKDEKGGKHESDRMVEDKFNADARSRFHNDVPAAGARGRASTREPYTENGSNKDGEDGSSEVPPSSKRRRRGEKREEKDLEGEGEGDRRVRRPMPHTSLERRCSPPPTTTLPPSSFNSAGPTDADALQRPVTAMDLYMRRKGGDRPSKYIPRSLVVHKPYQDWSNEPPPPSTTTSSSASSSDAKESAVGTPSSSPALASKTTSADVTLPAHRGGIAFVFPARLHSVLESLEEDGKAASVASWRPHGRAFAVHDPRLFSELWPSLVERAFRRLTLSGAGTNGGGGSGGNGGNNMKYQSFQRQLNLYGFLRISAGRDKGCYYHPMFLRWRGYLSHRIPRIRLKGNKCRAGNNPDEEPNFYDMPPVHPWDETSRAQAHQNQSPPPPSSPLATRHDARTPPDRLSDEQTTASSSPQKGKQHKHHPGHDRVPPPPPHMLRHHPYRRPENVGPRVGANGNDDIDGSGRSPPLPPYYRPATRSPGACGDVMYHTADASSKTAGASGTGEPPVKWFDSRHYHPQ